MKTEALQQKLQRYIDGVAMPAEVRQIQSWLSVTDARVEEISAEERSMLEMDILAEIQAYTAYPLFFPQRKSWWQKFTAFF